MTGTFEYEKGDRRPAPEFNVFFRHYATYPFYSRRRLVPDADAPLGPDRRGQARRLVPRDRAARSTGPTSTCRRQKRWWPRARSSGTTSPFEQRRLHGGARATSSTASRSMAASPTSTSPSSPSASKAIRPCRAGRWWAADRRRPCSGPAVKGPSDGPGGKHHTPSIAGAAAAARHRARTPGARTFPYRPRLDRAGRAPCGRRQARAAAQGDLARRRRTAARHRLLPGAVGVRCAPRVQTSLGVRARPGPGVGAEQDVVGRPCERARQGGRLLRAAGEAHRRGAGARIPTRRCKRRT